MKRASGAAPCDSGIRGFGFRAERLRREFRLEASWGLPERRVWEGHDR